MKKRLTSIETGRAGPNEKKAIGLARRTKLFTFAKLLNSDYEARPYLPGLIRALKMQQRYFETKGKEGIQNIAISMPRRHGKSELVKIDSGQFIASFPHNRQILVTYAGDFSAEQSAVIRDYIKQKHVLHFFPHLKLASDNKSKDSWGLAGYRGGMNAVGIMGPLTGRGFSLLIADDLIKNWEQANNRDYCDKLWDALKSTVLNGADFKHSVKIVIGTRWTTYDPIGRLLSEDSGEKWLEYALPALADEDIRIEHDGEVLYERPAGTALWPERYSVEELLEIKARTPDYLWLSQWQQQPVNIIGNIIKRVWIENAVTGAVPTHFTRVIRGWDLAFTDNYDSDYTVGAKLGLSSTGDIYLLDITRFKIDHAQLVPRLIQTIQADGHTCRQFVEINPSKETLTAILRDPRLLRHSIQGIRVARDKLTRATPFIGRLAEGTFKIAPPPAHAGNWLEIATDELTSFPGGAHDDIVDAISLAYNALATMPTSYAQSSRMAF